MNKIYTKLGSRSIFSDLELVEHGFMPVSHPTFTFNKFTFAVGGSEGIPRITRTYLIGEYTENQVHWVGLTDVEKTEIIKIIHEMRIFWIFSVYFGEIYLSNGSDEPKFHLYVRGSKNNIDYNDLPTRNLQ